MGLFDFLKSKVKAKIPSHRHSETSRPISELKKQIEGVGHPEIPFLHKNYSPSSRVPCTDFTGFIVERLQQSDSRSISVLMRGILEANPGVGMGSEWIDERIENVVSAPLDKYLSFAEDTGFFQLKAMWIIAEKSGGSREFWISDKDKLPLLFSRALSCYHLELKSPINDLLQKANRLIKMWRRDSDYWEDYPLFKPEMLQVPSLEESACRQKVLSLSVGARLHLFQAISFGGGSLPNLTDYSLRSFGLNIPETTKEILDSQLLISSDDSAVLLNACSKNDLIAACQESGVDFRKSWNKQRLLEALEQGAPEFVRKTVREQDIVSINPEHKADLPSLYSRSNQLENVYKILCFA